MEDYHSIKVGYSTKSSALRHFRKNFKKAISDYTKAIELNPRDAKLYHIRGQGYIMIGQYDKAIADYTKAIELNPRDAKSYSGRVIAYHKNGQYDKVISDCNRVIELNHKFVAGAYYFRGRAYENKGHYDKAISDYTKAIELNPKLERAYINRGVSYFCIREYENAWDDVYKAESLGEQAHPKFLKMLRKASGRRK